MFQARSYSRGSDLLQGLRLTPGTLALGMTFGETQLNPGGLAGCKGDIWAPIVEAPIYYYV